MRIADVSREGVCQPGWSNGANAAPLRPAGVAEATACRKRIPALPGERSGAVGADCRAEVSGSATEGDPRAAEFGGAGIARGVAHAARRARREAKAARPRH